MTSPTSVTSPGYLFTAEILISGIPQPLHCRADGRRFAAGIPGQPYTIRVTPLRASAGRIEIIATVDGRHVLDDEPGDPRGCQGLVTGGVTGAAYEFKGWRISAAETREFIFGLPGESVAARASGSAASIGVIGIAVHRERAPQPARDSVLRARSAHSTAPVAAAPCPGLGTGMGAAQADPVGRTSFDRDGREPDILAIGYDTEPNLIAAGIIRLADPDPFPGARLTGYANYSG